MKRREFLSSSALGLCGLFAWSPKIWATETRGPTPPPLSAYSSDPDIEFPKLSPDGQRVIFVTNIKDKKHLVETGLFDDHNIAIPLGDYKLRSIEYAGPDHLLMTTSVTDYMYYFCGDRHELFQAHLFNLRTGKAYTLFDNMPGYRSIVIGKPEVIKRDDQYFILASSVVDSDNSYFLYISLNEFKLGSSKPREVDLADSGSWVTLPNGTAYARATYTNKKWTLEIHAQNGWNKIYEANVDIDYPNLWGLAQDGKSVIVEFKEGPLANKYVEISPEGVMGDPIKNSQWATRPLFHPNTKRYAGLAYDGDWLTYDYEDPSLKTIADLSEKALEGSRFKIVDMAEDPRKVILYSEGAGDAGAYFYIDFKTGQSKVIGTCYPNIPAETIIEKKAITYKAADGLEIEAFLTLPFDRAAKNLPLIVMPHGGPQARDTIAFDWQVQSLISRGYAVLQPNFRGSDGYGLAFVEAGYGQWGKKMQTDLSDGVRYLAKQGTIDPKRVAIYGASYGGYAALAGATFDADIYRCAISVAGPSDLKGMLGFSQKNACSTKSASVLYWKRFWGDVSLDEISPLKHINAIKIPILMIHGKNDTVVPIDQSRAMQKAMKAAGKNSSLIEFDKEDHWQSLAPARLEMIEAVMAFLDKHNPAFI